MGRRVRSLVLGPSSSRRRRLARLGFRALAEALRSVPPRLPVAVLAVLNKLRLPGKTVLGQAIRPAAVSRLARDPGFRFSSALSRRMPANEVVALALIGAHEEAVEKALQHRQHRQLPYVDEIAASSLFELGSFDLARELLDAAYASGVLADRAELRLLRGQLGLIAGDAGAADDLQHAAGRLPYLMRSHHNLAARAQYAYAPIALDSAAGPDGRIYDAANFLGQRVTHIGQGQLGPRLYRLALERQKALAAQPRPPISAELAQLLDCLGLGWDRLRILPDEWFTQIGHLGMLDMQFRMQDLSWWTGQPLMLARPDTIANRALLSLFADRGPILIAGETIAPDLAAELVALQRWKGMTFNAFELPDGEVVPWQDAGALMLGEWERSGRGSPLRTRFDALYGGSAPLATATGRLRQAAGLGPDDWYVCVHMRDPAHYGELTGTGQTHRNADTDNYLDAIRFVVSQGGRVIKLGGPNSVVLPEMPGLFDYARSPFRSAEMDLQLIRHARYFIGTTSGLTNVAVSLGVPAALVNCITTDAQLWTSSVRFALKRLRSHDGRVLSQHELTSAPWRWRLFSAELLGRWRVVAEENSAREILETVQEVHALAHGQEADYRTRFADSDALINCWRASLAFPHYYGCAMPGLYMLSEQLAADP